MELIFGKSYDVQARWAARSETPETVAGNFEKLIDMLAGIDPLLKSWMVVRKKFDILRPRLAQYVASCISKDDFGEIDEKDGYWLTAHTNEKVTSRAFGMMIHAGSTYSGPFANLASVDVSVGAVPAPEAITFHIFKSVLLAVVASWAPDVCFAYPTELLKKIEWSSFFRPNWMLYLGPRYAPLVTPPETTINERFADGGLLMTATTDTFNVDNPVHMAAALDIGAAVAHLAKET
jgi:hypothetical protein